MRSAGQQAIANLASLSTWMMAIHAQATAAIQRPELFRMYQVQWAQVVVWTLALKEFVTA
jgi:hypothetical protein